MKKVGLVYSANDIRNLLNPPLSTNINLELIGLVFSLGRAEGQLTEPTIDLHIAQVFFDKTKGGYHFEKKEVLGSGDANPSGLDVIDMQAIYELNDTGEGTRVPLGGPEHRIANYELEFSEQFYFDYTFFTKIDLEILLKNADEIIISGATIIMGMKALDYGNTKGNNSQRFFNLKIEVLKPTAVDSAKLKADDGLEIMGVPQVLMGQPCPPYWNMGGK